MAIEFRLRPYETDDAKSLAFHANNRKIADNLRNAFPHPYTLDDARAYIEGCLQQNDDKQLLRAIEIDGEVVGSIGVFLRDDVYARSVELGYWLSEAYWGKGIMTEAVARICGMAFEHFDIVRIFAEPYAYNMGSCRVLEKSGFVLEGVLRKSVTKNGRTFDSMMYALIKEEQIR